MMPCNVIIRKVKGDKVEVAGIDPIASMQAVQNPSLGEIALQDQAKLKEVIDNL